MRFCHSRNLKRVRYQTLDDTSKYSDITGGQYSQTCLPKCQLVKSSTQGNPIEGVWPFTSLTRLSHEPGTASLGSRPHMSLQPFETAGDVAKADPQMLLRFAMCLESKSVERNCRFATPRSGPSAAKLT